jgi:hypothetical protein
MLVSIAAEQVLLLAFVHLYCRTFDMINLNWNGQEISNNDPQIQEILDQV